MILDIKSKASACPLLPQRALSPVMRRGEPSMGAGPGGPIHERRRGSHAKPLGFLTHRGNLAVGKPLASQSESVLGLYLREYILPVCFSTFL